VRWDSNFGRWFDPLLILTPPVRVDAKIASCIPTEGASSTATADSPQALVADAAQRHSSALLDDYDVADPIGGSAELHREVAEMIDDAVRRVVAHALAASIGSATLRSR